MTALIKAVFIAALGLVLGLASAHYVLSRPGPFDEVRLGAWTLAPKAGAADADPYRRAALARSGEIPIALGEGLQLVARRDSAGRPLDYKCAYRVGSRAPAARYWTLSVVDADGYPVANPAERYGLRSTEILRREDGAFDIYVSAAAHSGNWLPAPYGRAFGLVLRLYDTPLSLTASEIEKAATPTIEREACA